jgi:uncharacterized membrane protein YphA (DoxX/SURF4 family)
MKTVILVSRILLGGIFVLFGLNAFFQFIPAPPMQGMAADFIGALVQSGYFFPFMKMMEIVCGLMILSGMYMPMALLILLPINVNILLFHMFLGLEGMPMAVFMMIMHMFLIWAYRKHYAGIFVMKAEM